MTAPSVDPAVQRLPKVRRRQIESMFSVVQMELHEFAADDPAERLVDRTRRQP